MKVLRGIVLFTVMTLLGSGCIWAIPPHSSVLVTSVASALPPLTLQEARKLFLGVPLEKDGARLIPLLNTSDSLTFEVFLQKVAFMSANTYENQTLSIVFRLGGKRPERYGDLQNLLAALQQTPGTVTFLWEEQVQANQGIKSVSVLWQGSPD